jgi:hypothetical protein
VEGRGITRYDARRRSFPEVAMKLFNGRPIQEVDLALFVENQAKFSPEAYLPYAGQYIAYSGDGTRIVAGAETEEELDRKLEALGLHFSEVVYSYVPPDGVAML